MLEQLEYLGERKTHRAEYAYLAIVYSLPYALLMWA